MKELRTWHLCSNRWNSAITEYALRSAQSLKSLGLTSYLSGKPGSHCERRAHDYGVAGRSFLFKASEIFALKRECHAIKPDLIVTYGGPETFLARFLGVPVVRFRGQDSDLTDTLSPFSLMMNLGFCRGILTPAKKVADRFRAALPGKMIESVMLGLDANVFQPSVRLQTRPILLIVGRLDPIKGHKDFFEMFAELLKGWPSSGEKPFLEIIGERSNITPEELHLHAESLGLVRGDDYVIIDERVNDLPLRMVSATLGIIPSLGSEVIGRVTEEFLLSGTPVLISPVGTLDECLIEPDFGSILTPQTLKEWTKRANQETERNRNERAQKARESFSLTAMGKGLANAYAKMLGLEMRAGDH